MVLQNLRDGEVAAQVGGWRDWAVLHGTSHYAGGGRPRPGPRALGRWSGSRGVLAVHLGRGRGGGLGMQHEVEGDRGIGVVQPVRPDAHGVGHLLDRRDQFVAGREGEVVVQVLVAVDVDLRRELPVAGRRDEEVDMRRPVAVTAGWSSSAWVWPSGGQA